MPVTDWKNKKGVEHKKWKCPKCGLMRDNLNPHKHGTPLPKGADRDAKKEEVRPHMGVHREVD